MLKQILNPDIYHGSFKKKNFFEGWYFKLVDKRGENVISIIPGIIFGKTPEDSHSFIQILNGVNEEFFYINYPVEDFNSDKNSFKFNICENKFSLDGISLNINRDISLRGDITFKNVEKWPDSIINPGSMGYYNYLFFMECYSQVCALSMDLCGTLEINGQPVVFTDGKGYIEKNWGRAFPYSWIWIQCNNFSSTGVSLSASIGHIPFLITSFRGFLIGVKAGDKFYRFTTMNKTKISINQKGHDVVINAENRNYKLTLETSTKKEKFITCYGPKNDIMSPFVKENLQGTVHIELLDKLSKEVVLSDSGLCTGIEYGGDQMAILD